MFKRLESKWNTHTPVWLHNGTKENFIFQLSLTAVLLGGMYAYSKVEERRELRRYNY